MRSRRWRRFWDTGNLFPLGSPFSDGYTGTQNGWELLFHPPYSPHLAFSDYHLFGPLKYHSRGHHYEKPCEAGCEELERTSTEEAFLRFCNAGRNAHIEMEILQKSEKTRVYFANIICFWIYISVSFYVKLLITFGIYLVAFKGYEALRYDENSEQEEY
jgi:hypothetical protein